jgi:nucleoid DNA-binding protein|tara:strand:+ start:374 stop:661 length:288 start_codon:yes stop_codon:yes gene_type:complete
LVTLDIIKELQKKHPNLKALQIKLILEIIFKTITDGLIDNKPTELRGFGRVSIKNIKAKYSAINPKTLEKIFVPAKKKVSFSVSKQLKEEINKDK